jgi:hypothetical protein
MLLTKDAILAKDDLIKEQVDIPEWGGYVFVRCLTGAERDDFEASLVSQKGKDKKSNFKNLRARLVAISVVDEQGAKIFSELDIPNLGQKNAAVLDRLFDKAQILSGFKKEDIEDLTKNSEDPTGDDSFSD